MANPRLFVKSRTSLCGRLIQSSRVCRRKDGLLVNVGGVQRQTHVAQTD